MIRSPSLLRCSEQLLLADFGWSESYRLDASEMTQYLSKHRCRRVGHYFEALVGFYLERVLGLRLLARQLQIRVAGQTLGELDFVFQANDTKTVHLETAVKFYLYFPETLQSQLLMRLGQTVLSRPPFGSEFIGPNSADNLHRKTSRLVEHQLRLGTRVRDDIDECRVLSRGRIFYNPFLPRPLELPSILSHDHLQATWIRSSQVYWIDTFGTDVRFMILDKPFWLSDSRSCSGQILLSTSELASWFERHFAADANYQGSRRPVLFSIMAPSDENFTEVDRCFVVSDQWPFD